MKALQAACIIGAITFVVIDQVGSTPRGLLGSIGLMTPHSPSVSSYRTILTLRLEAGTMPHDLRQSDCRMSASGREADMCEPQDEFAF
jgi:hypothetical protein